MKKILLVVSVFLVCFLLVDNQRLFTSVLAQNENIAGETILLSPTQALDADRALAQTVRQLTNRSTEGLVKKKLASGGFSINLENRFQNVMLSRVEADGEPVAACVTSIEEANEFFGKNLETGELIFSNLFRKDDAQTIAARHGMSGQEFEFYTKLIADAAIRRAESPNAATINIVNSDAAGEGFNDATAAAAEGGNNGATRGAQRLNLFNFAAGIWGAHLDTNVPINISSQFDPLAPCTSSGGVLGAAGTMNVNSNFSNAEFTDTWYHAALANKRAGADLVSANAEIFAQFNSDVDNGCLGAGTRFYYGLDNSTPAQRINLLVVLLHEMGHGLGFSSFANGGSGTLFGGLPDIYTRFMYDRTVGKYWYQMTDAERQASAVNNGNVLWDGANVKIGSGFLTAGRDSATGRVQLYTPSGFSSGSSVSHFDVAATENLLMEPSINVGLPINLDLSRQQMRDIGWYRDTTADGVPDTITNVTPSGGTVAKGSTVNITWTNTGGFSRDVTIELSTNGGATYTTIASNVVNSGSFSWTVPLATTSTQQARVRVRESDFVAPLGVSSSNFGIGLAPTVILVPVSGKIADASGRGVSGARITLIGSNGVSRTAQSNAFGYFRFQDVRAGVTYFVNVDHKRHNFLSQTLNLYEAAELYFTPSNKE